MCVWGGGSPNQTNTTHQTNREHAKQTAQHAKSNRATPQQTPTQNHCNTPRNNPKPKKKRTKVPEVAFTGDTSGALFEDPSTPPDVFKAKLLIIELTFVDDSVPWAQARARGHMHIVDLVANAHKLQSEAVLLTHFSARYSRAQVLAALEANMPPALRAKCVPLLNGFA